MIDSNIIIYKNTCNYLGIINIIKFNKYNLDSHINDLNFLHDKPSTLREKSLTNEPFAQKPETILFIIIFMFVYVCFLVRYYYV